MRSRASPALGREHLLDIARFAPPLVGGSDHLGNSVHDRREAGVLREERGHRAPRSPRCRRRAGSRPPCRQCRASSTAGNASLSSGSNVQVAALSQAHAAAAPGTRSGQCSASAIGSRMSGGLAWAIVEPSVKVTIECTIGLRVHDDVDLSYGTMSNSRCRLDQLQALVDQGGRVDGDQRAHRPGRVGHRLLDGDVGQLGALAAAERAAGGGEHQPGDLAPRGRRAGTGRWRSARSRPAPAGPAWPRRAPAGRRRSATPCWPAPGWRRWRAPAASARGPREPGSALRTVSTGTASISSVTASEPGEEPRELELAAGVAALLRLGVQRELHVFGGRGLGHGDGLDAVGERLRGEQGRIGSRRPRCRPPGRGAGCAAATSRAWTPIEPVEPSTSTRGFAVSITAILSDPGRPRTAQSDDNELVKGA